MKDEWTDQRDYTSRYGNCQERCLAFHGNSHRTVDGFPAKIGFLQCWLTKEGRNDLRTCHFDKWHRWHGGGTTPSKGVHSRFTPGVEGIFTWCCFKIGNPKIQGSIITFPRKMAMESSNLAVSSSFSPIATAGDAWTCHFQVTQNHGSSPQFLEMFGIVWA